MDENTCTTNTTQHRQSSAHNSKQEGHAPLQAGSRGTLRCRLTAAACSAAGYGLELLHVVDAQGLQAVPMHNR